LEKTKVVFNMFHHVEEPNCGHAARLEHDIIQSRLYHVLYPTLPSIARAGGAGLHKGNVNTGVLQASSYVAIAASHVQEQASRRKRLYDCTNAVVAVAEPERRLFDGEARLVSVFRVGDAGDRLTSPNSIRPQFDVRCKFS
jgi:hypothetical protein